MGIHYVSTRARAPAATFRAALLSGLAPDGGLYVPDRMARIDPSWRSCSSIADLGSVLLYPYVESDMALEPLGALLRDALSFPVPLVPLTGKWDGVFVLELFHGPTHSFKDFGARTMARLMEHFLGGESCTILVATSGDTGSAVADGFAGRSGLRVALLFPEGQVSPTQESQLTLARPGVRAYRVAGTFDDCQRMVKATLASGLPIRLSVANSINIGRLLPQLLYYAWAFVQAGFDRASVCVPCGNLGNLTAGVMAALAGVPVRRFVAAHNANDGFPLFLAGGPEPCGRSVRTLSNAMDVAAPSNFERLQYFVPGMQHLISGRSITDPETLDSIRRVYEETGYVCDPHTAVALEAVRDLGGGPFVVLATAHPAKFPEVTQRALGWQADVPARLDKVERGPKRVRGLAATTLDFQQELLEWTA